jgi:undecaprenyl diphosphate synthase
MRLIVKSLQNETDELHANNIKLTTIGDDSLLPNLVKQEIRDAVEKTKNNTRMVLNLALSYSGRWELIEAVKNITKEVQSGKIDPEDIDEKLISNYLSTKNLPDPDLLIRSGGEYRVSNFLLWQIAYSELYVSDVLWPDFKVKHLMAAIKDFQSRERRFGKVSEQISNNHNKVQNAKKLPKQMAKI